MALLEEQRTLASFLTLVTLQDYLNHFETPEFVRETKLKKTTTMSYVGYKPTPFYFIRTHLNKPGNIWFDPIITDRMFTTITADQKLMLKLWLM